MTTDALKNHILGITNAKHQLHQTWAVPVKQATNVKVGHHLKIVPIVMAAATSGSSSSVSDDTKTKLDNIHKATVQTEKDSVNTYGVTVNDYNNSGTHTDDEWMSKLDAATDTATNPVTQRFTDAKNQAIDVINGLGTDDEQNAAADYYNRGLVYPVQLTDAVVYEINTIIQSVGDIILGILNTVEAVGNTIETAAVSILA